MSSNGSILAVDAGEKRVGLAVASRVARLPRPLITLPNNSEFINKLTTIIEAENVDLIVVGLPQGLYSGQDTAQTKWVRGFAEKLQQDIKVSIVLHDEALSSDFAKNELVDRGKAYAKVDVDALAATYILDDYMKTTLLKR